MLCGSLRVVARVCGLVQLTAAPCDRNKLLERVLEFGRLLSRGALKAHRVLFAPVEGGDLCLGGGCVAQRGRCELLQVRCVGDRSARDIEPTRAGVNNKTVPVEPLRRAVA